MFGFGKKRVILLAPLSGRVVSLEEVPDPVFAERMAGDGVAVEPDPAGDGMVVAPCAGELVALFATGHAFGIRTPEGVEVLVHIGVETVALREEGFVRLAAEGDRGAAGDPIVRCDFDAIRTRAPSALSLVLVTNMALVASFSAASGTVTAGKDVLLTLDLA